MTYNLNQADSIFFLAYLAYAHKKLEFEEANIINQTVKTFVEKDGGVDYPEYFKTFSGIIANSESTEYIQEAIARIPKNLHKKVLVYLIEGSIADRHFTENEERILINIANTMLEYDFYKTALEVLKTKYSVI